MSITKMLIKHGSWLNEKDFKTCWEVSHDRLPTYYTTTECLVEFSRVLDLYGKETRYGLTEESVMQ